MIRTVAARVGCLLALVVACLFGLEGLAASAHAADTKAGLMAQRIRKLLDETMDMKDFQQPMTLKEALGLIQDKINDKYKDDDILPILVDAEAFREEEGDNVVDVYNTQVKFPPFPRRMKIMTALRVVLRQIPTRNATFVVRNGFVEVTTVKRANPRRLLREKVLATLTRTPLDEAVEELSAPLGVTVLLDPRLQGTLKTPVTAAFNNDTTLEGALRLLADMAGARLFVSEDGAYITTPANAEQLQKERRARLEERWWEEDQARRREGVAGPIQPTAKNNVAEPKAKTPVPPQK
jgi:hypothetical protein